MNFFDQISSANSAIMTAFGESITLNGNAIEAVVDLTPGGHDIGGGMLVDKIDPSVTVMTADFSAITAQRGNAALIRGVDYEISSILPDDNGMTTITLRPV